MFFFTSTTLIFMGFHPLLLSPLEFIYAHALFQFCDGFSTAMLNFTCQSIPSALNVPSGSVQCAADPCSPWNGFGTTVPCCLSRKHWGGEALGQGRKNPTWVFHDSGPLKCYAISFPSAQNSRWEDGEMKQKGWRMMKEKKLCFHSKRKQEIMDMEQPCLRFQRFCQVYLAAWKPGVVVASC